MDQVELPGPPDIVYPEALKAIRDLLRLTASGGSWLGVLDDDLELFNENRQVTPTIFYNNMGTLPDIIIYRVNGDAIEPDQEPWANACLNTLEWLGQVAGKRIGPPREMGIGLFPPLASAARCPACEREYMYRTGLEWMAAALWAHQAVPRMLLDAGPEATARRSLEWKTEEECVNTLAAVERLVALRGILITDQNLITWPRSRCPACSSALGTRGWTLEGSPPQLVAGEPGE